MPQKIDGGSYYNFIFSQIMFYVRLRECQENLRGEPLAFSYIIKMFVALLGWFGVAIWWFEKKVTAGAQVKRKKIHT
jgi:hypothetical protein